MNTVKLAIQKPRKFERSSKIEKITCCIIQHVTCQNTQNFPSCNLQAAGVNFYSDKKYHMTNDRWVFDQRSESIWPWNWKDQEIEFYRPKIVGSIFFLHDSSILKDQNGQLYQVLPNIHLGKITYFTFILKSPQFKVERDKTWKTSTNTLDWIHFGLKIAVSRVMIGN